MTFCQTTAVVKGFTSHVEAGTLRCRCWHCEHCWPSRLAGLAELARRGQPTTFMTFTIRPERYASPTHAANALRDAWQKLVRIIKRRYGLDRLPALCIFESHKSGWPHLHVLARLPYIPQSWLSAQWEALTGAFRVDIQRVRSRRGAARYVAKYVSKAPKIWAGCKRYWRSLDWLVEPARERPPADEKPLWVDLDRRGISAVLDRWRAMGWTIATDGKRLAGWGPLGRPPTWADGP